MKTVQQKTAMKLWGGESMHDVLPLFYLTMLQLHLSNFHHI